MTEISQERKYELVDTVVTLNGTPAIIRGVLQDYPTVTNLGRNGIAARFTWQTVEHVVTHCNREFKA